MRRLAIALFWLGLFTFIVGLQAQDPQPTPPDVAHDPNSRCMRPDVADGFGPAPFAILPCTCHRTCVRPEQGQPHTQEDPKCRKFCRADLCLCETDHNACDVEPSR